MSAKAPLSNAAPRPFDKNRPVGSKPLPGLVEDVRA